MDRRMEQSLDRWLTTEPDYLGADDMDDIDDVDTTGAGENGLGYPGLSIEESNMARLQALNAIGVGINGVNEALMMRMLEELLGPALTRRVKAAHEEWFAEQLTAAEEKVEQMQQEAEEQRRKSSLLRRN